MTQETMPGELLIISCSARILAQSAARMGLRPVTLDLYADADTRACASESMAIETRGIGFDPEALLAMARRTAPPDRYPLVYGSGLDIQPELLGELARGRQLFGNLPEIHRLLRNPSAFFRLLDEFGIPYPEVRYSPPGQGLQEDWLIKAGCSEGGKRVRSFAHDGAGEDEYYQRRLPGDAMSVLFLANGREARVIGYNTLWTVSLNSRPWLFAGAINRAVLADSQRRQLAEYVSGITRAISLVGLNSLDFMLDGDICKVLEVNSRPGSTMALYDADFRGGLLAAHIRACQGRPLDLEVVQHPVRAFRVCFARASCHIPTGLDWPAWCSDRPVPGTWVTAGQPLCTLTAESSSIHEIQPMLELRESGIADLLHPRP